MKTVLNILLILIEKLEDVIFSKKLMCLSYFVIMKSKIHVTFHVFI